MSARRSWGRWPALFVASLVVVSWVRAEVANTAAIEERMRQDVTYLASAELEGRGPGTKGIDLAADYIAQEFQKAGLKPMVGQNPSYFQPFQVSGTAKLGSPNRLRLTGPQGQEIVLKLDQDFRPLGLSGSGKVSAPVVFAGYGVKAKNVGYDDFQDLDVAGKVVVIIRKTPHADNPHVPFDGQRSGQHAGLLTKMVNAELHKAAAVLFVNHGNDLGNGDILMDFAYTAAARQTPGLPAVQIKRSLVDTMTKSSLAQSLSDIERAIDRDLQPRGAPLTGWHADLEIRVDRPTVPVKNVIGVLEGEGPLAKETIVIGAHYDHLGYGGRGSLARDVKGPAIHHGADDNASGTTCLIELARRFGQGPKPARRIVFIAFSAEEIGLLGSDHYVKNPLIPLTDTVAMINLDMVGRLRADKDTNEEQLTVYGTGTAKHFDQLIDDLNKKHSHFKLRKVPGGTGPSDHTSFYLKDIPVLFFFTGTHPDYHKPSDTADKINVEGMRKIADLVEDITQELVQADKRPEFVKVAGGSTPRPSMNVPRLGIMPNYGEEEKEGLLLDGVSDNGPAAKAGLKAGDRIIEIGGKPVKDISTYMVLISNHKKGEPINLVILREGKKVPVKVVPE
ncbi:MAG: M20/M25/M40 family metallo-hydrolase [Gemmataceae bacterium]